MGTSRERRTAAFFTALRPKAEQAVSKTLALAFALVWWQLQPKHCYSQPLLLEASLGGRPQSRPRARRRRRRRRNLGRSDLADGRLVDYFSSNQPFHPFFLPIFAEYLKISENYCENSCNT